MTYDSESLPYLSSLLLRADALRIALAQEELEALKNINSERRKNWAELLGSTLLDAQKHLDSYSLMIAFAVVVIYLCEGGTSEENERFLWQSLERRIVQNGRYLSTIQMGA